jgi:hypothetical protein
MNINVNNLSRFSPAKTLAGKGDPVFFSVIEIIQGTLHTPIRDSDGWF